MDGTVATPTDSNLILAVREGDHEALRALYERHATWIALRLRRTLPAAAVEDVLQETFIAAWRSARSYRGSGDVGGWLWGIARRQAALWARRNNRSEPVLEPATTDPATIATTRVDLERALASLGPDVHGQRQRELARLVFAEERSTAEVAEVLSIPPGTVKSRVFTLRRRLRAALLGAGTGDREEGS